MRLPNSSRSKNSIGVWLGLTFVLVFVFIVYVGFSLHEERNYLKYKHKHLLNVPKHVKNLEKKRQVPVHNEHVSIFGMIKTDEELEKYNKGYKTHAFNELISDRIGFHARQIHDTRPEGCQSNFDVQAQVSVIICYYNEALSTLLRTINSVFERTSPKLLKEIIVVNDGSTEEYPSTIEENLDSKYLKPKLIFLKSEKQMGLIRARMFGARHATGDTLVFLDSHCEVNEGWIEPLLQQLVNHTRKVVSPVVDTIHSDTFEYEASKIVRGGFNWALHFSWEALPSSVQDPSKPYESPTISGGLFAVNRDAFFDLGGYDEDMEEWGGENLEISFRTWMCGGSLVIVPCSRVGHVFRRRRPYGGKSGASLHNAARVARVWLDDYKVHFYKARSNSNAVTVGDLSERVALRKKLKCKSFKWYLDKVYPEIEIPGIRPSQVRYHMERPRVEERARGSISVSELSICIGTVVEKTLKLQAGPCRGEESNASKWIYNSLGEFVLSGSKMCLEGSSSVCRLAKCDGSNGWQSWKFLPSENKNPHKLVGKLYNPAVGLCLSVNQVVDAFEIVMRICNKPSVQTFMVDSSI